MNNIIYERTVDMLEAPLGDELVALDADAGNCFGFNNVAATVWGLLKQPKSFEELRSALLSDFDVSSEQCTAELQELLDDLAAKGLVTAQA